jgi:predicted outer membrane repeat protein
VDTSTLQQLDNISCWSPHTPPAAIADTNLSLLHKCPQAKLGGRETTFSSNMAGASGGAISIEGQTKLAAFHAVSVNFLVNR